jgi:choline dehydrogenase
LSASGKHRVTVLEAGQSDVAPRLINFFVHLPLGYGKLFYDPKVNWCYETEPDPGLAGNRDFWPRGKVLGGSSSINGMVYVRGHARDYDTWDEMGAQGWAYADVLPYFKRMENWHGDEGDATWRGTEGPLHITRGPRDNPLFDAFIEAGRQAGYPVTRDYNGQAQEGFGPFEATIWKGQRWSAANAYLNPAIKGGNVQVYNAFARRVVIENGRATGVEVSRGTEVQVIAARREVIVSASSINRPKILMLSGIGAAAQLAQHGIDVVADRPGVGANLQDHPELYLQFAASQPITLFKYWNAWGKAWLGAQWLLTRKGLAASNQFEACAFIRSKAGIEYPDLQYHFLPIAVRYDGKASAHGHGFQVHTGPMRSRSRGAVTLRSADPRDPPKILFNYLSDPADLEDFRTSIRLTREIFGQEAMRPYVKGEIQPGAALQSDAELDGFIREHVESAYHPCGTMRMGRRDDRHAVVDPECRVIGVEGLRVADSSIFPQVTNGNLNAPSIMTGEKAADHILGKGMLARSNLEPWINPNWRTSQR